MVNKSQIKISLLRVLIITGLMLTAIFPGSAQALTQDLSTGVNTAVRGSAARGVSQIGRTTRRLAPFAGMLPSGTPFLPSLLINTIDTSIWTHPSTDPAGIAYQASTGKLLISDIDVEEAPQPFWDGFNIFQSTLTGSLSGNCTTFTAAPLNPNSYNNFSDEPSGITINNSNNHIFFSDDNANRIFEVAPGLDGAYCTSDDTVTYVPIGVPPFNVTDSEDLAYGQNKLYITSGGDGSASIYEYDLGINGVLGGGDDSSGTLPNFGTSALGFSDVEGIAYNSVAGTLYILSTHGTDTYLGETTTAGTLLGAYDLSYLGSVHRSGLTVAPASGDPSTNNIYIVSRGEDNGSTTEFNDGKIWEIDITSPVMPDLIFKDGFESNDFSRWTLATTNNGNLNVNASAALVGSYGMRAQINTITSMDVMDENPTLESRYRARFYFDPNSIVMNSGDNHIIFQGYNYSPYTGAQYPIVFRVDFRNSGGLYQVRGVILNDSAMTTTGSFFTITDSSHFIEVDWRAASSSVANNGYLTFWIDGVQMQNLTGIDNDTHHVDRVRLGPTGGLDATTSGTYYFDAFESRRLTYIGEGVPPTVVSIERANASPTSANTVDFTVTFSEPVTGVDTTDFTLVKTGAISGETVTGVSGLGNTYAVTVNTGSGDGTIGLDLDNSGTGIVDAAGNAISGGFTGEIYTILKSAALVDVNIAGSTVGNDLNLPLQSGDRYGFAANDGPAQVVSANGLDIIAAMRMIWQETGERTSYSEMMGLPLEQLSDEYWFPWYNNLDSAAMNQGFRIANVDATDTTIKVMLGATELDSFTLPAGESVRVNYPVNNGPIQIYSVEGNNIIAALRVIWQETGERTSYSEMMGLPKEQLSTEYWFPWYNNLDSAAMSQGFRIANVDATDTTIKVMLGATELDSFTLPVGESVRVNYPVNNGPIQIYSVEGNNILAALRVIWQETGERTSYSEMMGLPKEQLSDEYWFPWYNNLDSAAMNQGFRIANVDATDTTIKVMLGATELDSFTLLAGESVRVNYPVNNGPIQIFSVEGNNILAALRVIWQETGQRTSYSEMMGLPKEQLSSEYWFPWYNNLDVAAMSQGFRISAP